MNCSKSLLPCYRTTLLEASVHKACVLPAGTSENFMKRWNVSWRIDCLIYSFIHWSVHGLSDRFIIDWLILELIVNWFVSSLKPRPDMQLVAVNLLLSGRLVAHSVDLLHVCATCCTCYPKNKSGMFFFIAHSVQCESKKSPPHKIFWHFSQTIGNL